MFIERQPRLVRPANYPPGTPGRGATLVENAKGARLLVANLLGTHLHGGARRRSPRSTGSLPPARSASACEAIVVDVHAEATARKRRSAFYADGGREPDGRNPYACAERRPPHPRRRNRLRHRRRYDGDYDSVIGMEKDEPLRRFTRDPLRPVRAGERAGDALRVAVESGPPAAPRRSRRCASAAVSARRVRRSGTDAPWTLGDHRLRSRRDARRHGGRPHGHAELRARAPRK